jgi:hypothetical protein
MKKLILLLAMLGGSLCAQPICNAVIVSQGSPVGLDCPVDSSTGITQYGYVKWDSGAVGLTNGATSDTAKLFVGIADQTVAAGAAHALVHTSGPAFAAFDGATTAGDSFTVSTTSAHTLHDTGVAFTGSTCANGTLGIINQTIGSSGNAAITIQPCIGAGTVASGTAAMGTSAIASGACATVVTVAATGILATDTIVYTPNTNPTGITGYAVSASGSLYIWAVPTSGNVSFYVCNNTSGSLTPGALTLNWRVIR